ncbi:MAG: SPOR domain-containing protein [Desulfobacterales bacterium]|jgi:cell division septation protein DedD
MKSKSLFLSIAVILVLVAVYIIWHYSPLRYLTQSESGSEQTLTAAAKNRRRPVIVAKKISPEPENSQQTGDPPRPLVVLKKIKPEQTLEPVQPQVEVEIPAATEKKTAPTAPGVSSSTQMTPQQPAAAEKPVEPPQPAATEVAAADKPVEPPHPPAKKVGVLQPDSYHPYSIMLSSCRLPQSARKIVSDYTKAGLRPYIVKVKFENGDEWLRVLTGHYQTRHEAIQAKKDQQLSKAIVKRTPYTNLIGTYGSPDEMQADLQQVKKLGYSPYFLQTPAGQFKLLVGAFVTEKGAQNLQAELQAKGIQNTVVIR